MKTLADRGIHHVQMPEILSHKWFTSQAVREIPGRPLVSPPSLDEVERPVNNEKEVDPDILGNLKTLWHGAPDEAIIEALLSKESVFWSMRRHCVISNNVAAGKPGRKRFITS